MDRVAHRTNQTFQMKKIIFLDIDGVVNCCNTRQRHRGFIGIDPYMAFIVGKIVLDTGASVVLSSSWRCFTDGRAEVEKQVVKCIDQTPVLNSVGKIRGDEIKAWLDKHPEVEDYVILDDNSDMLEEQMSHFYKTKWETGITEEIAQKVVDRFGRLQI